MASGTKAIGEYGSNDWALSLTSGNKGKGKDTVISPWHDVALKAGGGGGSTLYNAIIEIPMFTTAKLEVQKTLPGTDGQTDRQTSRQNASCHQVDRNKTDLEIDLSSLCV